MGWGKNHYGWSGEAVLVEDIEATEELEYLPVAPVCYHCINYFGPITYGFCRRYEIWVKTNKTCVYFEPNTNNW